MSGNFLQLAQFNAIVVGDGAIGSALLDELLGTGALQRVAVLGRSEKPAHPDSRVARHRFNAEDPGSIEAAAAAVAQDMERAHLLVNTVSMLHGADQQPEKRLKDLEREKLLHSFAVNATLLPLLAQGFSGLLRHKEPAMLASLSARVGSIEDNRVGGWYSYRASKAAHNMLLRTLAREWRVSHRNVTLVALHPGTVQSRLSEPFISPGYKNRVLTPSECATALLQVMANLDEADSGSFYDWQGKPIPW